MKFIQGKPRNQWEMYCIDMHVDTDNEVRLIDLFVDSLHLSELGLRSIMRKMAAGTTRPAVRP
jgi:transposase